uniref:Probable magnesium transporter n=1 Tax=Lactuca sativa TaxID=4236 RepID=A0A9R1UM41_LACSA|nr:hypothetical protein LSAT_V11C800445610 [Lactuca sativa]
MRYTNLFMFDLQFRKCFTQTDITKIALRFSMTERHALLVEGINGKTLLRPIISIQSWRIGILFFAFGNALNFISFGYAAQSLLAALGSIQFVSNIAFSYFVLQKTVTSISCHNFYCSWKHLPCCFWQSPITWYVYTQEQLAKKYSNITFLFYCLLLVVVVLMHHYDGLTLKRRGELLLAIPGKDLMRYWKLLLPFSVSFFFFRLKIGDSRISFYQNGFEDANIGLEKEENIENESLGFSSKFDIERTLGVEASFKILENHNFQLENVYREYQTEQIF